MAKSPFYKVVVEDTGQDITRFITGVTHEDCLDKDDEITITVEGVTIATVDKGYFKAGQTLSFIMGFIGGQHSAKRYCLVNKPSYKYVSDRINVTVVGADAGILTKKVTDNKVYKGQTATEIVKDIAKAFGLKADVDTYTTKHENMPVANKNYMQFLQELARKEGSSKSSSTGPIQVWVTGKTLHFKNRDLSQKSNRTFVWRGGRGIFRAFDVNYEDDKSGKSLGVKASGIDMDTGEDFTSEATPGENKEAATGSKALQFDVNGTLKKLGGTATGAGKTVATPANSQSEADLKTGAAVKAGAADIVTCEIEIEFDPTLEAGMLITVSGVAQEHAGNWYIEKCTQSINGSGASTKLSCTRNGSKSSNTTGNSNNAGTANDSQGSKDGNIQKGLLVFNANGVLKQ